MNITHPELVKALVKAPDDIISTLTPHGVDLWHGATGVAGECGELMDALLTGHSQHGPEVPHIMEELGDIAFYMEQIRQRMGWEWIPIHSEYPVIDWNEVVSYGVKACILGCGILDTVKKCAIYNKEIDAVMLEQQMHQLDYVIDTIGENCGVTRAAFLGHNIQKLSKRYEGLNYSDAAAQERADKPNEPKRSYIGMPQSEG